MRIANWLLGAGLACNVASVALFLQKHQADNWLWLNLIGVLMFGMALERYLARRRRIKTGEA